MPADGRAVATVAEAALRLREERWRTAMLALADIPEDEAAAICLAVLDAQSAGRPAPGFVLDMQAEAGAWAESATPAELRAYGGAILRRLQATPLVEGWRKRLLVTLWESCPADWRQAFLRRVDPEGRYRGRELRGGRRAA